MIRLNKFIEERFEFGHMLPGRIYAVPFSTVFSNNITELVTSFQFGNLVVGIYSNGVSSPDDNYPDALLATLPSPDLVGDSAIFPIDIALDRDTYWIVCVCDRETPILSQPILKAPQQAYPLYDTDANLGALGLYKEFSGLVLPGTFPSGADLIRVNEFAPFFFVNVQDFTLTSGGGGPSGYSGFSGRSGYSGSGISGFSGFSGASGFSGYSGPSGYSGLSGYSGRSGWSGFSGISGFSGVSGFSGYSGKSGFSGYSGRSGFSGYSGTSGFGHSGVSGFSGDSTSGYSGVSGFSGDSTSGFSGYSGVSGFSGSGVSGFSGYSGVSGFSGYSGVSGFSGYSGISGFSGYSGVSGFSGYSGYSGYSGFSGYSGHEFYYVPSTGSANAYAVTLAPAPGSYVEGLKLFFKANFANTGPATLDVNGLGPIAIKKNVSEDVEADDIKSGAVVLVVYDGTYFQMTTGAGGGGTGDANLVNVLALVSLRI